MKKNLIITIAGETSTGKSSVAYLIKNFLREKGIEVEFDGGKDYDTEEQFDDNIGRYMEQKIEALKEKVSIKLEEKQLSRPIKLTEDFIC